MNRKSEQDLLVARANETVYSKNGTEVCACLRIDYKIPLVISIFEIKCLTSIPVKKFVIFSLAVRRTQAPFRGTAKATTSWQECDELVHCLANQQTGAKCVSSIV